MLKTMCRFEKFISLLVILVAIGGMITALVDPLFFETRYVREDGIVETSTAIALLLGAFTCWKRGFQLIKKRQPLFLIVTFLTGLIFFFGAGEEISWGQRYFGFQTPPSLKSINTQGELNLHNIEIKGIRLNKLIFSQFLTFFLITYFLVLPFFYKRKEWLPPLFYKLAIPLPRGRQVALFFAITIFISLIPQQRRWELMEFSGSFLFWMILLYPANHAIFDKNKSETDQFHTT